MMMSKERLSWIASITIVTFVSATAFAENGRTVAAFVLAKNPKKPQAAAVMSSILREHLSKLTGVTLRTGAPAGNAQAAIEASRLADEGFRALNSGDKATALARFQSASDVLAQNPGVGETRLHARVAKGLGVASFMNGKTTAGKDLIKRSLLLYTKQSANEYAYSVEARNLYAQAQREIADMAQGRVEVKSTPDAAEVYLDGIFKGYTPITLPNVAAGSHLVNVEKDGYLRWSGDADVPEGGRAATEAVLTASPVKKDLDKALDNVSKSLNPKKFGAAIEPVLGLVDAKEALVVTADVGSGGFELSGFYRDLAGNVQPIDVTIAQDAEFFKNIKNMLSTTLQAAFEPEGRGEALDTPPKETIDTVMKEGNALGGDQSIDPDSPLFKIEEKGEKESIAKKWWFWTIIGAVTAGTVATVVVLTTGTDEGGSGAVGNLTIQLNGFNK